MLARGLLLAFILGSSMGVKFASSSFLDFVANIFGVDIAKKEFGPS
jgi:hypothetical protein